MKYLQLLFTLLLFAWSHLAVAQNHVVKLITANEAGETMLMEPGYLKISVGDTVTFVPADVTHNVESMLIPHDAKQFTSQMGKEFTYTFSKEGVYLYKCTPHFIMGMVGVIQVDQPVNIDQILTDWKSASTGVALNKERVQKYLEQVK